MQAAKKSNLKENQSNTNNSTNNINSETITKNNINFENIAAANEQACENVNLLLDQFGQMGFNLINLASNMFSNSIKSTQSVTEITSEFIDEVYSSSAGNLKESLMCNNFTQIADLTENTINKNLKVLNRYSNDMISLCSLNFDKLLNHV